MLNLDWNIEHFNFSVYHSRWHDFLQIYEKQYHIIYKQNYPNVDCTSNKLKQYFWLNEYFCNRYIL